MFDELPDGIETAGVKWVTAQKASRSEVYAADGTVFLDRLAHVFGAGRVEAAGGRQKRREKALVGAQQKDQDLAHRSTTLSTSRFNSSNEASRARRLGLMTISQFGPISGIRTRKASRTRRRMRLRTTALPSARGTVNPIRAVEPDCSPSASGPASALRQKATNKGQGRRNPLS